MAKYINSKGNIRIGEGSNPLAEFWKSNVVAPEITAREDSRFIAGRVYNYTYNDVAECVPSDGSVKEYNFAMVLKCGDSFKVCNYDMKNHSAILGPRSDTPGFGVGWNPGYSNPIFVATSGMVWVSYIGFKRSLFFGLVKNNYKPKCKDIGLDLYIYKNNFILKSGCFLSYGKKVGTIIDIDEKNSLIKVFIK